MNNLMLYYKMKYITPYKIYESEEPIDINNMDIRIGDLCLVKSNLENADFWLKRNGSSKSVGKPTKIFSHDDIGIKVISKDVINSDYLYYYFTYLHQIGEIQKLAIGSIPLVHIRVNDIKNIKVFFK